jgi:AcrR family transcriptional regulator
MFMTVLSIKPVGLRERKKLRTREALADAAFELFQRQGFEATTIDEIAEQVELSPRTFFRHFASKEDVALTLMERQFAAIYDALALRPADEPVVTALRHATVEMMRSCEAGQAGFDPERFSCAQKLIADNPSIRGRALELAAIRVDELAAHVAKRMGVDPATDPRPTLVAAVATTAVQTAMVAWRELEPETPSSVLADRALALLEEGINYPSAG